MGKQAHTQAQASSQLMLEQLDKSILPLLVHQLWTEDASQTQPRTQAKKDSGKFQLLLKTLSVFKVHI